MPFVIAGKDPSKKLIDAASKNKNTQLVANPFINEMDELIKKAHVHILPSFNRTGIKIKLLNALFNGRFVVTNHAAIEGTSLSNLCEVANTSEEYKNILHDLFNRSFTGKDILERKKDLEKLYNNKANAEKLMQWIW